MKELGIYVHFPFCVKKCAYCDFLSGPAGAGTIRRYVQALLSPMRTSVMLPACPANSSAAIPTTWITPSITFRI